MFLVHIKQVATGIVRRYGPPQEGDWNTDANDYMWADGGNYSCDCNRALFFARAAGEDDIEQECGDVAYLIRVTDEAGKVLYDEFES